MQGIAPQSGTGQAQRDGFEAQVSVTEILINQFP